MKFKGFTLAEVLITLAIIGIISAISIPSLLNSSSDEKNKVAWKKAYAEFAQVTQQIVFDNGGSLLGIYKDDILGSDKLKNAYATKMNIIKDCSAAPSRGGNGGGISADGCWHTAGNWGYIDGSTLGDFEEPGFILNNGTLVLLVNIKSDCSGPAGDYTRCAGANIDINGFKGPNVFGKDIFGFSITTNTIIPYGARNFYTPETDCIEGSTYGFGCSAKYLYE